ncbi:MAG: RluA family pseudouridine synthase [Gammaproteobacteria bacterium]|nr:RluA family pseudouridine synthase [Gammaproteobacteria bacterium]
MPLAPKKLQKKGQVRIVNVENDFIGQRIDNYLIRMLKGLPKTHLYRLLRKGEIRVNKKRIGPDYRLAVGDSIRLPPLYLEEAGKLKPPAAATTQKLIDSVLYEDKNLLILNKPPHMSVHAGNTVRLGIIETLKFHYTKLPHLELAHRLDSETSGCLILAKKRGILKEIHTLLREGKMIKKYWALTKGEWNENQLEVDFPLEKHYRQGGRHVVEVTGEGKSALTHFKVLQNFPGCQLVEATLFTGRTHQIRVHAAHSGHPIAGDDRYGESEFNKFVQKIGLKRMFLHARVIEFTLPSLNQEIRVQAPLDPELEEALSALKRLT